MTAKVMTEGVMLQVLLGQTHVNDTIHCPFGLDGPCHLRSPYLGSIEHGMLYLFLLVLSPTLQHA